MYFCETSIDNHHQCWLSLSQYQMAIIKIIDSLVIHHKPFQAPRARWPPPWTTSPPTSLSPSLFLEFGVFMKVKEPHRKQWRWWWYDHCYSIILSWWKFHHQLGRIYLTQYLICGAICIVISKTKIMSNFTLFQSQSSCWAQNIKIGLSENIFPTRWLRSLGLCWNANSLLHTKKRRSKRSARNWTNWQRCTAPRWCRWHNGRRRWRRSVRRRRSLEPKWFHWRKCSFIIRGEREELSFKYTLAKLSSFFLWKIFNLISANKFLINGSLRLWECTRFPL